MPSCKHIVKFRQFNFPSNPEDCRSYINEWGELRPVMVKTERTWKELTAEEQEEIYGRYPDFDDRCSETCEVKGADDL